MNTEQMRVPAAGRALVQFISGRPLISLLLGLLIVMGLGSGLPGIKVDFTYRAFFAEDDKLMVGLAAFDVYCNAPAQECDAALNRAPG